MELRPQVKIINIISLFIVYFITYIYIGCMTTFIPQILDDPAYYNVPNN